MRYVNSSSFPLLAITQLSLHSFDLCAHTLVLKMFQIAGVKMLRYGLTIDVRIYKAALGGINSCEAMPHTNDRNSQDVK